MDLTERSKLYVTRPFLPPLVELLPSLEAIWQTRNLTNGAEFHQRFESALADYLGVPYVSLFTNATIALVTALQCLRITGEVITTPYSFVATAHSLLWNGVDPVFVDIDRHTLALDPAKIEAAITPRTTAIMPVHVYGRPADVDRIERIADTYGLRVIYDTAHAFGAKLNGRSLADFGDISVLSFHATKVFNTFEGGAIICRDAKTKQRVDHLKNFGFVDEVTVVASGINGKMNEFQSALGLLQLNYIDANIASREEVARRYDEAFGNLQGISFLDGIAGWTPNYSYYPIFVGPQYSMSRDVLYHRLRTEDIYVRRYFYPLISDFPMYRGRPSAAAAALPVAKRLAEEVLCLPIFPELTIPEQSRVIDIIREG